MSRSWFSRDRLPIVVPTVVGVLGVVTGLVLALVVPATADDGWSADAKAVNAVAENFVVTFNTYDAAQLDDYRERVAGLVTSDLLDDIEATLDEAESVLVQAGQTSGDVVVRSVGTTDLEDDAATAVVVFTFTMQAQGGEPTALNARTLVDLSRSGSTWKVSDYGEIPVLDAETVEEGAAGDGTTPAPEATP